MSVFEAQPRVQDLRARQQALKDAAAAWQVENEQKAALVEKYEAERRAWEARCRELILAGKRVPKEPTPPDLGPSDDSPFVFQQHRQELAAEEQRLRVELADECLPEVEARMAEHAAKSSTTLDTLDAEFAEFRTLARERRAFFAAQGRTNVPVVRDLAEYIAAVRTGVMPVRPSSPVEKVEATRRLGKSGYTNLPEPEDPYRTRRPNARGARF